MGKDGGGYDAGPMLQYGQQALDLQERIYNDSVDRGEPFYNAGEGAINMLADYLGINGGSQQTRSQIYNEMLPQYTREQTTTQAGPEYFRDPRSGQLYSVTSDGFLTGSGQYQGMAAASAYGEGLLPGGKRQESQSITDYDALNKAVDDRFGSQETPDYFGTLLENFSLDKFHEDPGYQFRLDEGQKAIERAAAARGQYYDPSTVKELSSYNSGMADQTYNDAYNRYNLDQNNIFNRLAAVSGIGQTATGQINATGQNYANQSGNIYGQMGNAVTAANVAEASQPSMFDTLLGVGSRLGGAYLGNPGAFA